MPSTTVDEFRSHIAGLLASPEWRHPVAFGIGIASLSASDPDKILDTYYGVVNLDENQGFAALVADIVGHDGSTGTVRLNEQHLQSTRDILAPAIDDGGSHPNAELLPALAGVFESPVSVTGTRKVPVITFIGSLDDPPSDVHDAYLRLHLLSHRKVRPNCLNLDGVFGLLENVVWTSLGPCDSAGFEITRTRLRALGTDINVFGLDKFPRMVDYVIPSGVRIADADRVRLGAHLAEGTTVMHEGFVNFNAGTLGNAMVEGRISSGVVVGANSDIGGGASIMGTLSGGGKEVVAVGERCLIGANGGTGISLGDGCTIEAGLYVTAGTKVTLPDGSIVKARDLSGRDSLLFRRSSTTGVVEVLPTSGSWEGLNVALHSNT